MSSNESLTPAAELSEEQAITIQPTGVAAYGSAADWPAPAEGEGTQSAGFGATALLHSLRRHWLVIVATGIAAATVAGVAAFLMIPQKYEATATILMEPSREYIVRTADDNRDVPDEFEIFKQNQAGLIKQKFVLMAALRNQKLKSLSSIKAEDERHNAVPWLTSMLEVGYQDKKSGLLNVGIKLPNPVEASAIVNAVVDAYMTEVVNRERLDRRNRLDSLQKIAASMADDVKKKRDDLSRTSQNLGGEEQSATVRVQTAQAIFMEYQHELQRIRWQKDDLLSKLAEAQTFLESVVHTEKGDATDKSRVEIPDTEVVALLNNDPTYKEALAQKQVLENYLKTQRLIYKITDPKRMPQGLKRPLAQLDYINGLIKDAKDDSTHKLLEARRIDATMQIRRMAQEVELAVKHLENFEKEVARKQEEAANAGQQNVDIQMQRAELENKERIYKGVADEREKLTVDLEAPPRVRLFADPPTTPPETEANFTLRLMLIGVSAFAGLCLPGLGILVWDMRRQRVNSSEEVAKKLKLQVMGTLPYIPTAVMRKLGSPTRRSQIWKARYTEAVDGIVARLLRNAECDDTRAVLITSAMNGEGKTWLATQVAMGLARAERRTVLVDFDLRHPALDGALGLPLGPGVCEALRGEGDIAAMVQPTDNHYLSVVTAGSWSRQIPPTLANGSVGTLLERLRENFDFVIIDSSPLLPVVDSRLVCQHVDGVLLSVLRDTSESGKVTAAQEMLDAFGVSKVHAVVTGGEHYGNAKSLMFHVALAHEEAGRLTDQRDAAPADEHVQTHDEHGPLADEPRSET